MKQTTRRRPPQRVNDPEGTRRDIIDVATEEFAGKGFSGARVDRIAARTRTSKRMIYYYFGGKEGLYIAVLEEAYRRIRTHRGHARSRAPAARRRRCASSSPSPSTTRTPIPSSSAW